MAKEKAAARGARDGSATCKAVGKTNLTTDSAEPQAPSALHPLTEAEIAARSPSWHRGPLFEFWHLAGLAARITVRPLHVFQIPRRTPFSIATNAPGVIYLLSDRGGRPTGPDGFDRESVAAIIGRIERADVVSGEVAEPYLDAIGWANVISYEALIVETAPGREAAWAAFIREHAPGLPLRGWRIVTTTYPAGCGT